MADTATSIRSRAARAASELCIESILLASDIILYSPDLPKGFPFRERLTRLNDCVEQRFGDVGEFCIGLYYKLKDTSVGYILK